MSEPQFDTLTLRETFRKADLFGKAAMSLALWFGAGLLPKAPGTFGALAAVPLAVIMRYFSVLSVAGFLIVFIPLAIWASDRCEKLLGREDPKEVVIDEVAGFFLAIFLLPPSWLNLCLGFVLFRFFDIVKPFPIGWLDQKIKGGTGIVLDDLVAGIYANCCIRIFLLVF